MQVKCDYCGAWMEDTEKTCPNCSAANANLARVAAKTPKTIEELISWYKARNLPPFETTRFFIGENYKGARAFGIYEEGGEYIVYKNKSDGSRAIRYKGTDEAYAVNEIYLRLKEEILNQKNTNQAKKAGTSRSANSNSYAASSRNNAGRKLKGFKGCLVQVIVIIAAFFGLAGIGSIINYQDSLDAKPAAYYLSADKENMYYHGGFVSYIVSEKLGLVNTDQEWWMSSTKNPVWQVYDVATDKHDFPEGLSKDNLCGENGIYQDLLRELGLTEGRLADTLSYNVEETLAYKDAHHHAPFDSSYYYANGQTYYYLYDSHSSYSDNNNNTGWYIYDDDDGWEYYCTGDDHDTLGDELWYNGDDYLVDDHYDNYQSYVSGNIYNFTDEEAGRWNSAAMASDFADTTWYREKSESDDAYYQYWDEHSSSSSSSSSSDWDWSSDSDWDWDSSDSWDSGGTDWDSDW